MSRLIDADALEKVLRGYITDDRGGNLTHQEMANNEAIVDTMRLIHDMPTIEPQRWIPVDEGRPKDGTDCLVTYSVTYSNGHVEIATFAEDLYEVDEYNFHDKVGVSGWFYFDDEYGYQEYSDVIAWMPLPEPYKGGRVMTEWLERNGFIPIPTQPMTDYEIQVLKSIMGEPLG